MESNKAQKVIVINPRYDRVDSDAIGINGIRVKGCVLGIAEEMIQLNKTQFNDQPDIYLTRRYKDTLISLSDRTKLTKVDESS
ncbi:hypothetical protein [Sinomicrobium sp. M5D2P9]